MELHVGVVEPHQARLVALLYGVERLEHDPNALLLTHRFNSLCPSTIGDHSQNCLVGYTASPLHLEPLGAVGEGEYLADEWSELAGVDEASQFPKLCTVRLDDEVHGLNAGTLRDLGR